MTVTVARRGRRLSASATQQGMSALNCQHLLQLLRTRRSTRKFRADPVPRADVQCLLEAARWAPSNHNRQAWRFLVLQSPARIAELAEVIAKAVRTRTERLPAVASPYVADLVSHASLFAGAPALVVALHRAPLAVASSLLADLAHPELVSGEPLSTAMAVQNLLLAAHALGLGACVMTAPLLAGEQLDTALGVEPPWAVTCLIALGWPAETPDPPRRKDLGQIAEFR